MHVLTSPLGIVRHRKRNPLNAERFEIVVKGRLSPTLIAVVQSRFEVSRCNLGETKWSGGFRIRPACTAVLKRSGI